MLILSLDQQCQELNKQNESKAKDTGGQEELKYKEDLSHFNVSVKCNKFYHFDNLPRFVELTFLSNTFLKLFIKSLLITEQFKYW